MQPLRTSVYHPQTNVLVKRFNGTLKLMLQMLVNNSRKNWPQWVPFLLFSIWEVPQASMEFFPFDLLYGRQPQGILVVLQEEWETLSQVEEAPASHLQAIRKKMWASAQLAQEELQRSQEGQKRRYDAHLKPRSLEVGQQVLLLLPSSSNKLLV